MIDNTKGQVINFEAILEAFPDHDASIGCVKGCDYGSAKHMMTVQKLLELLPDGFVLVECDGMDYKFFTNSQQMKAALDHARSLNGLPFDCEIVDLGGNNGYMFK